MRPLLHLVTPRLAVSLLDYCPEDPAQDPCDVAVDYSCRNTIAERENGPCTVVAEARYLQKSL